MLLRQEVWLKALAEVQVCMVLLHGRCGVLVCPPFARPLQGGNGLICKAVASPHVVGDCVSSSAIDNDHSVQAEVEGWLPRAAVLQSLHSAGSKHKHICVSEGRACRSSLRSELKQSWRCTEKADDHTCRQLPIVSLSALKGAPPMPGALSGLPFGAS